MKFDHVIYPNHSGDMIKVGDILWHDYYLPKFRNGEVETWIKPLFCYDHYVTEKQ